MTTPLWPIPAGTLPSVIDLSHFNAGFDSVEEFEALKAAGVALVIHKATQGSSYVDPMYTKRRPLVLSAGLLFDAYHFATSDPVPAQLAHFLSVAEPDHATMRLMLDAEQNRGATITPLNAAQLALDADAKLCRQVVRYGNASVLNYKQPGWQDGPLFWAKYGPEPTVELMKYLGINPSDVVLWQETCTGRVAGSGNGNVDLSYYRYQAAGALQLWPAIPGFEGMATAV